MDIKDIRVWLNPVSSYKMLLWQVPATELLGTMEVLLRQDSLIKSSSYQKIQMEAKPYKDLVNKTIVEIQVVVVFNNVARLSSSNKTILTGNQTNSHRTVKAPAMIIKKL